MANKIVLKQEEQNLYDALNICVGQLEKYYSDRNNHDIDNAKFKKLYAEMNEKAYQLHQALKSRGIEPKHHKYMLKNRKVPVDDKEFYNHLHPVEDLIAFINDPDANNDPEDTTIGESFKFEIYTRRWGYYDAYILTRTENGWKITGGTVTYNDKECNKDGTGIDDEDEDTIGKGGIFDALDHDFVNYPLQLDEYLEALWNCAAGGADKETMQRALNSLAEWVSACEKSSPRIDILEGILW